MPTLTPAVPLLLAATLVVGAGAASAQPVATPDTPSVRAAAAAMADATPLADPPAPRKKNPIAIGAAIGAAAGAALTAGLASAYGNNEGGGFCGACFVRWGTVAIPVGAAAGAGVGWALKASSSPSQQPGLFPPATQRMAPPRRKQLALTLTF